jgi:hypothetical protein
MDEPLADDRRDHEQLHRQPSDFLLARLAICHRAILRLSHRRRLIRLTIFRRAIVALGFKRSGHGWKAGLVSWLKNPEIG